MTAPETVEIQTEIAEQTQPPQLTPEQAAHFEEQYLTHKSDLMSYARRFTDNIDDAEDLVQEVFARSMRTYGAREDIDEILRPILFRSIHNCFMDGTRKKIKFYPEDIASGTAVITGQNEPQPYWGSTEPSPEITVASREAVRGLIGSLIFTLGKDGKREQTVRQRLAVLLLMDDEGYKQAEVADILEMNKSTVGSGKSKFEDELATVLGPILQSA
jgi:DNA-directed RNA polymerase specialized sigma24 family protein